MIKTILQNFKFIVVSVCFRLAPEFCFPTQINDCEDALEWAIANALRLHIDESKLYLAGSSAGGNLAAVLAQVVRDKNSVKLSGVLLNGMSFKLLPRFQNISLTSTSFPFSVTLPSSPKTSNLPLYKL
jgi:acetyl esterase/lipase